MGDKPEKKPTDAPKQVDAAIEQAVEQVQAPQKEKQKLKVKLKAAKERTKLGASIALGQELFSGVGELWKGVKSFLKGVFSGMKDEMPDREENKKEKKARSKRRMTRLDRMSKHTTEKQRGLAQHCQEQMEKPGWNDAMNTVCKEFRVCPATMMAIIQVESNFNPKGYPKKRDEDGNILRDKNGKAIPLSSAKNLGQLLWGTKSEPQPRQVFMKKEAMFWSLDPLKRHDTPCVPPEITREMTKENPIVGFIQLAWLTAANAKFLKIDPADPANGGLLYLAHHDGAGKARKMKEGIPFPVPETYQDRCSNFQEYRELIFYELSMKVGGVATVLSKEHGRTLEALEEKA